MKITFLAIGKTPAGHLAEGYAVYENRLKHYISYETVLVPDIRNSKNMTTNQVKDKEADLLMKYLKPKAKVFLLDEQGKEYTSMGFAGFIQLQMNSGVKEIIFVSGGAYGFSGKLKEHDFPTLSFSKLTFSHQLIRLVFAEQLYRAFTIIRNEPYHHA